MTSINEVRLLGYIAQDLKVRYTPIGDEVVTFQIVTSTSSSDDTSKNTHQIQYTNIVSLGWLSTFCQTRNLKKGSRVYIEGRLQTRSYQDPNNITRKITDVIATKIILLSSAELVGESHVKQ